MILYLFLGPTYTETMSSLRADRTLRKAYEACYRRSGGIERLREEDEAKKNDPSCEHEDLLRVSTTCQR